MNKQQNLPTFLVILHIAIRISIANSPPITDCDEVFNYWEPLHYLQYGYGMQTWEYAPQFALRTYAYLLPMSIISTGYNFILQNCPQSFLLLVSKILGSTTQYCNHKLLLFHLLRSTLSLATAISEIRLIQSLPKKSHALCIWISLLTSTGMYHAAPAYLPSATVMIFLMNSLAEQYRGRLNRAIFWGILACLMTGWPFCGILFIPLGLYAVYREFCRDGDGMRSSLTSIHMVGLLLGRVVGYCMVVQGGVMMVDYVFYGKMVSPTWNIFVYNTGWGREDGVNRDELYGVEDAMYYVKNLVLNWNGLALCSICSLPLLVIRRGLQWIHNKRRNITTTTTTTTTTTKTKRGESSSRHGLDHDDIPLVLMVVILSPMYLWLATVLSRPHKEERFLFPIYPLIAIGAVIFLDECLEWCGISTILASKTKQNAHNIHRTLMLMAILPCALVSMSRSMLLTDGYTAPLKLYTHLHRSIVMESKLDGDGGNDVTPWERDRKLQLVCTGGEWHRFPSSFYLPDHVRLAFVKSSFDGQLPQPFTRHGSRVESLSVQKGRFNDLNEEEMDRYVDLRDCSFAVELVSDDQKDGEISDYSCKGSDCGTDSSSSSSSSSSDSDPEIVMYMQQDDDQSWETVVQVDFLNVDATPFLHRILYLPVLRKAHYKKYTLYRRMNNKLANESE